MSDVWRRAAELIDPPGTVQHRDGFTTFHVGREPVTVAPGVRMEGTEGEPCGSDCERCAAIERLVD